MLRVRKLLVAFVAVALCGAVVTVGIAGARSAATTNVTIKYNGDGFQGKVKSSRAKCVANRKVKVYKQKGNGQDLSIDKKYYTDNTDSAGRWDTGTSGQVHGKFYAYTPRVTGCKRGFSTTIKV